MCSAAAMETAHDDEAPQRYVNNIEASPGKPILIDRLLESASEVDADA